MAIYTLKELARASGVSRFNIRHYVRNGDIPPADGAGSTRHYTDEHLHRLLAVKNLRSRGIKHIELGERMKSATEAEILQMAGLAPVVPAAPPPPPPPSLDNRRRATLALVIATADALETTPKRARAAALVVLQQMKTEGLGIDEALALLQE